MSYYRLVGGYAFDLWKNFSQEEIDEAAGYFAEKFIKEHGCIKVDIRTWTAIGIVNLFARVADDDEDEQQEGTA